MENQPTSNRTACVPVLTGRRVGLTTVLVRTVLGAMRCPYLHLLPTDCTGFGWPGRTVTRAVFGSLSDSGWVRSKPSPSS